MTNNFGKPILTYTLTREDHDLLFALGRTLRGRPIETTSTVDERHDLTAFTIESARPFPYQVDGDYLGETRRLRFEHRPEVMDLVFPLSRA